MNHKKFSSEIKEELNKHFEQWFSMCILGGRPQLLADTTIRTYPYINLMEAYAEGIAAACDILAKHLKEEDKE